MCSSDLVAWVLHKVDTLLKRIVLMSDAVMKSLTNSVVIILLHRIREKRSARHFSKCQIFNLRENFIHRQYEWNCEVFIVYHILFCVSSCPSHLCNGRVEKGLVEILKDAYSNLKKRKFYNTMLQKADLNILEYRPIVEDRFVPNDFRERIQKENIPEEMKDVLLKPTYDSITFLNHSDNGDFDIPLRWQSKGTQKYIRILDALYDLITSPHVYYLDELGEDLHNDLLYYYLNVFIFNSDKSQLVITSQETTLLSQDMINENRGVVWFVEKNKETASSEYARGDSFGLHKNLSLYNSYRIGRDRKSTR